MVKHAFGWHSGKLTVKDIDVLDTLYVKGTLNFGDAAADVFTVTGKLDANGNVDLGSGDDTINIGSGSGDTINIKDDATVSTNKKLQFRDSGIYLQSNADGKLTIAADGTGTDDITLSGTVTISGGLAIAHTSTSSNYTASVDDCIIGVDTSGGAVTVTLPSAGAVAGKVFVIHDEGGSAGTNNITVATEGSETIDGNSTATINSNYGSLRVYSDGTNYFTF